MKKALSVILALVILATMGLAGCAPNVQNPTEPTKTTAAETPTTGSKDKGSIHILGTVRRYAGEAEAWDSVIADFEKQYGVKVTYQWQGKVDDMITNLQAAKMANEKVDLCTPNGGRTYSSLAPNGMLMDITKLMEPLKDRFNEGMLEYYTIGGHLWGFPYGDRSSSVLYYNKTMFDELGLKEPVTFDDLLNIGEVIKEKKGIMPMIHQGKTQSYWLMYYGDIYAQTSGNKSISNVSEFLTGKSKFTGEAEIAAFDYFKKMYDAGLYTSASFETDADGMKAAFAQQKAAMFFGGTWELAPTRNLVKDFELGVTSLPRFVEDSSVIVQHAGAPDYGMSIPSFIDQDNLGNVMQFVEFILRKENAEKILSTYQPISCAIKGVPSISDKYAQKISTEMVPKNTIWIDWVMPLQMNNALMQAVPAAMSGAVTPEQAAQQVQTAYDNLVKDTGYKSDWWNQWTDEQWKAVTPTGIPSFEIK